MSFLGVGPLIAGSNVIGNVGGKTSSVTVTPTVSTANAYGVNFVVGGLLTFANAFTATLSGVIQSVVVNCKRVEAIGFTFVPFTANPSSTTWTNAAVAAINTADVAKAFAPIYLNPYSGLGTHTILSAAGLAESITSASTSLFGVLVSNAALTNNFTSTSDITVTVTLMQDA